MPVSSATTPAISQEIEGRIPWSGIAAGIAVILCLGGELIAQLRLDWTLNPSYGYGWSVPFISALLFWFRWNRRPRPTPPLGGRGCLAFLVLTAGLLLPLRILAKANPDWRLVSWAVALCIVGIAFCCLFLTGGWRWVKYFAFPVLFLLVSVPWPNQLEQKLVQRLMGIVTGIDVELLTSVGIAALQHGNVIQLATGNLGIEDACSGIRSLQSTFMLSLFLGEFYALKIRQRLYLLLAGAGLAFAFNIVRTFLLAYVASRSGPEAVSQWHDTAGWSVLAGSFVGLWGLSLYLKRDNPSASSYSKGLKLALPSRAFIGLTCWLVATELGASLWFQVRSSQAAVTPQWTVDFPGLSQKYANVVIPEEAEALLHYNEGRAFTWQDEAGKTWEVFFFKWFPGQTAALFVKVHRPEICLPASGFVASGGPRSELITIGNVSLPTRAYTFKGKEPLHVYYCYWDGSVFRDTEEMVTEDWTMRGRLHRAWNGKRDQGAQTLEVAVWGYDDDAAADLALKRQLARLIRE
jgi:exosortase